MLKETLNYEVIIITYIITRIILEVISKAVSFIFRQIKERQVVKI